MDERHTPRFRTVHLVLPATGRPLCGYEEEAPAEASTASPLACAECSALLRSGLMGRRPAMPRG
jgi:hypothetical protein